MPRTNTLIPWPGGKTRLLQHLLPLLSDNPHTCYVEAFAGGAALLFARSPAKVEVLNDTHGELVRLYRVVAHHLDEFVRQFRWALTSREMFRWAKLQHVDTLTDIQRAARFYYLQRLAFGGKVAGQTFGTSTVRPGRLNLLRIEEELSAAHLRLHGVTVEQLPWQECLSRYDAPHTLFFLDPPYWQTEGYGAPFGWEQYEQLAEAMAHLQGAAILTINDHPDMRRLFDRFDGRTVPIRYTIGGRGRAAPRQERIYVVRPEGRSGLQQPRPRPRGRGRDTRRGVPAPVEGG
ncbi:MAG: DNA adenine methylase [Pseudomonadota bacterium]